MILILLKNHFKRNRLNGVKLNPKNIAGIFALVVLSFGLLGLLGFILFQLTTTFSKLRLDDIYLTTTFFILLIVLVLHEIVNILKQLFQNKDNEIYAKLPVKKEVIFLSKIIYMYINQLLISIIFLSVTAGVYGLVNNSNVFYYLRLLVIAVILPLLPLSIASLLAIPASYFMKYIKKNKFVLIGSIILILGIFFVGYIGFVQVILKFINLTSNQSTPIIPESVILELKNTVSSLKLSGIFYDMLVYDNFYLNLGILVGILLVVSLFSYYILKLFYFKALSNENIKQTYKIKKDLKVKKPLSSIVAKEAKIMTRNPNYAFQAIVMNILMPIFVFLTIKLTDEAGKKAVGEEIVPGITFLTVLIFILLANSFQGTLISREKEANYISKIIPIKYFRQILARLSFGLILNTVMITVSLSVLYFANFLNFTDTLYIFLMSMMFILGYTFSAVTKDYKNPQFTSNDGGIDEGINMYQSLLSALIIAVVGGMILIFIPYFAKLFPGERVFKLFGFLVIRLTAYKVNLILYSILSAIMVIYAIGGYIKINKAVLHKWKKY